MKNLIVITPKIFPLKKNEIHKVVGYIKNYFKFTINFLEISFISGEELLAVNKKYLSHDFRTDIITFGYSDVTEIIDGELLISFDDAVANSLRLKISVREELIRLVIHGILHLLGYDDTTKSKKKEMSGLQEQLVSEVFGKQIIKK